MLSASEQDERRDLEFIANNLLDGLLERTGPNVQLTLIEEDAVKSILDRLLRLHGKDLFSMRFPEEYVWLKK